MKNKFDVYSYVEGNYAKYLNDYEESYGSNGLDMLWESNSEEEVDLLFAAFLLV